MSNNDNVTNLCERLRVHRNVVVCGVRMPEYINPDGPEAADTLERQAAENKRLREALAAVTACAIPIEMSCPLQWSVEDRAIRLVEAALTGED